ncbi:hypothetical protein HK096_007109 [Nowakowskiella sp. JEL0078]|nr:hypothetical protein HK096_007109 [Nowakowskiella sp. JEL0078]
MVTNDSLLLELLDTIDKYQAIHSSLQKHENAAFFDLAQAKFSMDPLRFTQLQYDNRMRAGTMVSIVDTTILEDLQANILSPVFSLCKQKVNLANDEAVNKETDISNDVHRDSEQKSAGTAPAAESDAINSDGLRRRRGKSEINNSNSEEETKDQISSEFDASEVTKEIKKDIPPEERDPLKWFGILVPSKLRSAQQGFKLGS